MITKILTKSLFFISIIGIVSCSNNQSTKLQDETEISDETTAVDELATEENSGIPEFCVFNEFQDVFGLNDVIPMLIPMSVNENEPTEHIVEYIDWLIDDGKNLCIGHGHDFAIDTVVKSIREFANKLQRFKDGDYKYFPIDDLKQVLNSVLFEIAFCESHAEGHIRGCIVFPRLLEIGAFFCPDINMIASHCSEDHKIGIVQIDSDYNYCYNFVGIIATNGTSCRIGYLPDCYTAKPNKIRKVGIDKYILSNEDYTLKDLYLVTLHEDGDVQDIIDLNTEALNHWTANTPTINDLKIYFNPNELSWSYCKKNSYGNLEKIEGTKSLYLDLFENSLRIE